MRKLKLSEALRMAISKDVEDIDEDAKSKKKQPEPDLAVEAPASEHFEDCRVCHGTGLDGDVLCKPCAGSGRALPSTTA